MKIVLAGGGTAGHVNPLLSTAAAIREAYPEADVVCLGTDAGLETELVPAAGFELKAIPRVPLPRRPSLDLVKLPVNLRAAIRAAKEAISDADAVVGFGGYVSTPAYFAANSLDIPFVVHEGNARPGLANKVGARWAATVALTFSSTDLKAKRGNTVTVGLPMRSAIAQLAADGRANRRAEAAAKFGLDPARPVLLVTGGSSGAVHINEVISAAAPKLLESGLQILHITGKGKDKAVRELVSERDHHVLDYLTTMEDAYAVADLAITRSGAGMVAELSALGIPAIFVPLPVGNGEQALNARDVVDAGGALLVRNEDFSAGWVESKVPELFKGDSLARMSASAQGVSPLDAAARLAKIVTELA